MQISKKQMAELVASGRLQESFTHLLDGVETVYNVTKMREWARNNLPVDMCSIDQRFIDSVRSLRDSDPERVNDPELNVSDPLLIVMTPPEPGGNGYPTFLLVDGIHRLLRRWEVLQLRDAPCYVFTQEQCIYVDKNDPTWLVIHDAWGEKDFMRKAQQRPHGDCP